MNKQDYRGMWVYIEHDGRTIQPVSLELCCEIRRLADAASEPLTAVLVGELPAGERDRILDCGVDTLLQISGSGCERFSIDAYTELFTRLCRAYQPSAVFVGGSIQGRDFAPRFACRLSTGCTSDATELLYNPQSGDIEFVEPAVGGKIMAVITVPVLRPQVATIRPGTFRYAPAGRRPCEFREERFDFPPEQIRSRVLAYQAQERDESLNLTDTDCIVCVGNAVKADSLPKYRLLAERLGGKLACTRPVFDRGLLPFKLVIGQSGVVVKPKLLLSFGVSGAANHVTGLKDSECIVAVNKDPEAAIFHYCDYGIVGDMDEICEAMLKHLAERTSSSGLSGDVLSYAQKSEDKLRI